MAKDMRWKKAIEQVLRQADGFMHYKDIAEQVVSLGLRKTVGATPAATAGAQLTDSLKKLGDQSPFVRVGRGEYALRKLHSAVPSGTQKHDEEGDEKQYDIVSSFGMFWRRNLVRWVRSPLLLGRQQIGAEPVNFNNQIGIYLLYDGREVIYVGRATDRPLGGRLYEHTLDRLSARWDRFSWFGLRPVSDKGNLDAGPASYEASKLVPALEAILIEALEPRQNRKRGDDLSAVEYLQAEDPELEKLKIKEVVASILEKA